MNRWVGLGLLLITVGALVLRVPQLGLRPMHNDEAVNALKVQGLWEKGRYAYDPNEHHGPTLYYATLPFVWLSGAQDFNHLTEGELRAVSVFFGVALILLLWMFADGLGSAATLIAGVLTAISPAMVFYSRYFIHELLLVFFTMLLLAAGWRYSRTPKLVFALAAGFGLGMMYATKETFALALVAAAAALGLTRLSNRGRPDQGGTNTVHYRWSHVWAALAVAGIVSLLFFTSFFTNASGPLDSLRTYMPWLKRAGGESPHVHAWYFYLERLAYFRERKGPAWSEGLILLLALIGALAAFLPGLMPAPRASLARFLTFYTAILTAEYSVIAYKTPWCMLGFLHGMILLAGLGAVVLIRMCRGISFKGIVGLLLICGAAQLTWQAWRAGYTFCADRRNPYVYAQTVPDVLKLVQKVRDLARVQKDGAQMVLKVMAPESDYWPLPWYLRQFKQVGWWDRIPSDPYSPVMIVGAKMHAAFDEKTDKAWIMAGFFELRPSTFLELYVQFSLWENYVKNLPREPEE